MRLIWPKAGSFAPLIPFPDYSNPSTSHTNIHSMHPINEQLLMGAQVAAALQERMKHTIVGQEHLRERLLVALLSGGHILLEGLPGLAKTLAIKTLAEAVGARFGRIQFTPDMLPADVTGTLIYSQREEAFKVKRGPIFAHFVLADEINRAPAKVQSALLEAMQEGQVTLGEQTLRLPELFMVMATQNPIEQEGTYPLPEAQTDRFMMKVKVGYPSPDEEVQIVTAHLNPAAHAKDNSPVAGIDDIMKARDCVRQVYVDPRITEYAVRLVWATRAPEDYGLEAMKPLIATGASPRAGINLCLAARALALMKGRTYVLPDDVRELAPDVLRARLCLTYEADAEEMGPDDIVSQIVRHIPLP